LRAPSWKTASAVAGLVRPLRAKSPPALPLSPTAQPFSSSLLQPAARNSLKKPPRDTASTDLRNCCAVAPAFDRPRGRILQCWQGIGVGTPIPNRKKAGEELEQIPTPLRRTESCSGSNC
jgi:hypothetical protein